MPNKKPAAKELRKRVKREVANAKVRNNMKQAVKNDLKLIAAKDAKVKENLSLTVKLIDKAAKKGVIKKNTASRKKSRLMKKINALK